MKATNEKEEVSARLLEFLESPHITRDVVLAENVERGRKRKSIKESSHRAYGETLSNIKNKKRSPSEEVNPNKGSSTAKSASNVSTKGKGKMKVRRQPPREPTEEEMRTVINDLADEFGLQKVSTVDLFRQLEAHFKMDLRHRREEISRMLDDVFTDVEEDNQDNDADASRGEDAEMSGEDTEEEEDAEISGEDAGEEEEEDAERSREDDEEEEEDAEGSAGAGEEEDAEGSGEDAGEEADAEGSGEDAGEEEDAEGSGKDAGKEEDAEGSGEDAGQEEDEEGSGKDAGEEEKAQKGRMRMRENTYRGRSRRRW